MATAGAQITNRAVSQAGQVQGGLRFDWMMTVLSAAIVGGVYVDGWAHSHGRVDQNFFTPWHAILYGAFSLAAIFLLYHQWRNIGRGYRFWRALPVGYPVSLIGIVLFALGGFSDMLWHMQFGIEKGIVEILVSPSHLIIAMGGIVIISGVLRSGWYRLKAGEAHGWQAVAPVVISVGLCVAGLVFFTQYAHPYRGNLAAVGGRQTTDEVLRATQGVSSIIIQCAILMSGILLLARHWRLPFGWITLLCVIGMGMITTMDDHYFLLPSILIGGLLSDGLYQVLKPYAEAPRYYVFAFLTPIVVFGVYLAWIGMFLGGLMWLVHVWTGTLFLVGIISVLISFMYLSPLREADKA